MQEESVIKMKKHKKTIILFGITFIWMLCIFKLSSTNSTSSNGKSADIISIFIEDALNTTNSIGITNSHPSSEKIAHFSSLINAPMRKVMHATVYFILANLSMIALNRFFDHKSYIKSIIITLLLCILFAASDEIHQLFVPGRSGKLMDVIIDSFGAVTGILYNSTYYLAYKFGYNKANKEIQGN